MFAKTYQGWVMVFMLMLAPLMCGKVTARRSRQHSTARFSMLLLAPYQERV